MLHVTLKCCPFGAPTGRAGLAVVGKHRNLCDASLIFSLGDGNFRNDRVHRLYQRDLRHIHRRQAEQQVAAVGADRSRSCFNDEIGIFALFAKIAAVGQQVLTHGADQVILIYHIRELAVVKEYCLPRQRLQIHGLQSPIDRVGNQELLGCGSVGVGRARSPAACERQRQ